MAEWKVIGKDIDRVSREVVGATFAMKVPGGMIIRSVFNNVGSSMVFVPMTHQMISHDMSVTDQWIEENKVL